MTGKVPRQFPGGNVKKYMIFKFEMDQDQDAVTREFDEPTEQDETNLSAQPTVLQNNQGDDCVHTSMKRILEEKEKEFRQQLLDQSIAFEMILIDKEREHELLKKQISESEKEINDAKQQAVKAKEDVLSNIVELMDGKLQCSICREYFMKATSLNCSHVFCKLCIKQWMKVKQMCPNCRCPITTQIRIPALDACIEKMIEQLDDEAKKQRANILQQRQAEQDALDNPPSSRFNALNVFMRGRGGEVEVTAAIRRAMAHTQIFACSGVATLKRTAAHTKAFARKTIRMATSAFTRTQALKRLKAFTNSAVLRRAAAFARTTIYNGTNALAKSAVLRKAAALARMVAFKNAEVLRKSAVLETATAIAKASVLKTSNYLKSSAISRKATKLAMTFGVKLRRHPTVRRATMMTSGAIKSLKRVKKGHIVQGINHAKSTAFRCVAGVGRRAANIIDVTSTNISTMRRARSTLRGSTATSAIGAETTPSLGVRQQFRISDSAVQSENVSQCWGMYFPLTTRS